MKLDLLSILPYLLYKPIKGNTMKVIKYSEARNNLRSVLDTVSQSCEPTCIVSNNGQAVLMDKAQYDAMIQLIKESKA